MVYKGRCLITSVVNYKGKALVKNAMSVQGKLNDVAGWWKESQGGVAS